MEMAISAPRFTIDDIDQWPDDGNRYELLDGMLIVTPSASFNHQRIATKLAGQLQHAVGDRGVVVTPGAVQRGDNTQLLPDILVADAKYSRVVSWREIETPWLVVEVFSRSSIVYDRTIKRDAYFALGVREVWLVDPVNEIVEVSSHAGAFEAIRDVIRWRVPDEDRIVSIDLTMLF
jgi:Uma2 family endonuclease